MCRVCADFYVDVRLCKSDGKLGAPYMCAGAKTTVVVGTIWSFASRRFSHRGSLSRSHLFLSPLSRSSATTRQYLVVVVVLRKDGGVLSCALKRNTHKHQTQEHIIVLLSVCPLNPTPIISMIRVFCGSTTKQKPCC